MRCSAPSSIAAWICFAATTLTVAVTACAQQTAAASGPMLNGIAHVAVRVSNLNASRTFYKKLGFEEAFAFDQGGNPTEAFIKVNDTQFIELYPQRQTGDALGFLHVCFLSHDLEALNQAYRARGLSPTEVTKGGAGNLLFSMSGPGLGNIEFTQYMPGSRHSNDVGQHLGQHRISTRIAGVAFPSNDPKGAAGFYTHGMAFVRHGHNEFSIPYDPADTVEVLPAIEPLRLTMEVADLKQAARELHDLGIPVKRQHSALVIYDPDGNGIQLKLTAIQQPQPN
jgi:catechol 2,3-dioxygenase-like lactoylglutathione lyase family enzyme